MLRGLLNRIVSFKMCYLIFLLIAHIIFASCFDTKNIAKKWSPSLKQMIQNLMDKWAACSPFNQEQIQLSFDSFMLENQLKPGDILPVFRIGLAGTMKGPAVFDLIELWGMKEVSERMKKAFESFDQTLLS